MDLANYDLIEALSKTEKPIIISTGMSSLSEVHKAVSMLKDKEISILHCISDYPLNPSDASLQNIKILLDEFPNHKIGFSDHSLGKELAIIAVTLGAKIIEKHFTLDRNDKDIAEHHFSMLTDEFREMVDWLKIINIKSEKLDSKMKEKEKNSIEVFIINQIEQRSQHKKRKVIVFKTWKWNRL